MDVIIAGQDDLLRELFGTPSEDEDPEEAPVDNEPSPTPGEPKTISCVGQGLRSPHLCDSNARTAGASRTTDQNSIGGNQDRHYQDAAPDEASACCRRLPSPDLKARLPNAGADSANVR